MICAYQGRKHYETKKLGIAHMQLAQSTGSALVHTLAINRPGTVTITNGTRSINGVHLFLDATQLCIGFDQQALTAICISNVDRGGSLGADIEPERAPAYSAEVSS